MMIQSVRNFTFRGVRPEYKRADGTKVFPIAKDPNGEDIKKALAATKAKNPKSGLNGSVYPLGSDLVVKRYKSKTYAPEGERDNLDKFFESGTLNPQIQKGMFGFETPDGANYLVTTRIKGENPTLDGKNLNKENLLAVANLIAKLDGGKLDENGNYVRFMHYDLGTGNLNFSERNAGVFDFEYSRFENLEGHIKRFKKGESNGSDCNRGDIAPFPSNMRGFEYRTLERVLRNCENPREIFMNHLSAKSEYHFQMAKNFEELEYEAATKLKDNKKAKFLKELADKERLHGFVLRDSVKHPERNKDIIKAEAMKIQLARYIYSQSPFANNFADDVFNPEQMKKYFEGSGKYFKEEIEANKGNLSKRLYFEDCAEIMKGWDETWGWTMFQMTEPDPTWKEKDPKFYEETVRNYERIMAKIIDTTPKTLEEIIA